MADESPQKQHRSRARTFSGCSTLSSDDGYHDASEQIVEDVTLDYLYKPRSITAMILLFFALFYFAFTREDDIGLEENIWAGVKGVFLLFLVLSLLVMPNGPFIRPHPALWRMVFGVSVMYLMILTVVLFLSYKQVLAMLSFIDPELKKSTEPDMEMYNDDCSLQMFWKRCDIFTVAHFLGWAMKAMLMRHAGLCWTASINWEITEVFFAHLLPNFKECWWDSIIMDLLICNGLGIHFGLFICKILEMRTYHWESIKDIQSTTGKIKRTFLQFTPASWTHVRWMDPKCSYMRYFAICQLIIIWQIVELNTFFLKHIFLVPTRNNLNLYRLWLIGIISAPALRQYYIYITDTRSRRVGTQCWVFVAITLLEALVCIKHGKDLFAHTDMLTIIGWLIFQLAISMVTIYFMVMTKTKRLSGKISSNLENIPSVETTKTVHYINSMNGVHFENGHETLEHSDNEDEPVSPRMRLYTNGLCNRDEGKPSNGVTNGANGWGDGTEDGMNGHADDEPEVNGEGYGVQTRLRTRRAKAVSSS